MGVHSITFNRIYLVLIIHTDNQCKRNLAYQIHIHKRALSTRIISKWILRLIGGASASSIHFCATSFRCIGNHGLQNFALPFFFFYLSKSAPLLFSHPFISLSDGLLTFCLSVLWIHCNSFKFTEFHNVFKMLLKWTKDYLCLFFYSENPRCLKEKQSELNAFWIWDVMWRVWLIVNECLF